MNLFLLAVVCLIGGTLLMLLRPWRNHGADDETASRDVNARIYRDQLAELDRDRASGTLSPTDHGQAREELQRRLLEDTRAGDPVASRPVRTHRTPLLLAVALPLAAAGLYAWLGTPAALLSQGAGQASQSNDPQMAQIEQMVARLAARLEKNPNDPKGWAMLAHSYRVLNRYAEAADAYARMGDEALNKDPALLAAYADTLATLAGGNIEGRPLQLVMAALKLDPQHPMSLSLAATAAYRRGDFPEAARYWQQLLKQLPPDSDDARFVAKTLAEIGAPVSPSPSPSPPAEAPVARQSAAPDPTAAQIEQMVARLAARLEKNPNDPKGWAMLAHSYRVLGRHAEAANAYARIGDDALNKDPSLLANYADTLATLAGGKIDGRPLQLVMAALKLDPNHPMSLSLAATAAYRRGDLAEAAGYWQHLLKQLPPDSDDARFITKTLAEIGARAPSR
jgi:cytochrome c-type biogenesis protein CcmH